jgi:dsRNA-specific ribonuclease
MARRRALRAIAKRMGLRSGAKGGTALLDAALTHDSYAHEHHAGDRAR